MTKVRNLKKKKKKEMEDNYIQPVPKADHLKPGMSD